MEIKQRRQVAPSEGLDIGIPHTDQACVNDSPVAMGLCEVARWHQRPDSAARTAAARPDSADEPTCKPTHCWLCLSFLLSHLAGSNRTGEITAPQDCWDLRRQRETGMISWICGASKYSRWASLNLVDVATDVARRQRDFEQRALFMENDRSH